jgi:methionine-rich copper-binding protein CopC
MIRLLCEDWSCYDLAVKRPFAHSSIRVSKSVDMSVVSEAILSWYSILTAGWQITQNLEVKNYLMPSFKSVKLSSER